MPVPEGEKVTSWPQQSPALFQGDLRATKGWRSPDRLPEPLYVVVPIFNAWRWKSRWKHAARAIKHFMESGAVVYIVEAAFGDSEHAINDMSPHKLLANTPPIADVLSPTCRHEDPYRGLHRYIPLRTRTEAWIKENLINVGVSFLPRDWQYVAWLDADLLFSRSNWVGEALHLLQHYAIIQMFSHAQDLGPDYTVIAQRPGFVWAYEKDLPLNDPYYYPSRGLGAWSGLAWACRRDAWDALGGLPDYAIHGGCDFHIAHALIGKVERSIRKDIDTSYRERFKAWEGRAERYIRRNVGCMTGTVQHAWHGKKVNRHYGDRHKLLAETKFNPNTDLKYDSNGLIQLVDDGTERFIRLRDGLRRYALERNEDSIDV